MLDADRKMTVIVTWMTAFLAGFAGLGLPLAYFGISYTNAQSALQTEAEINARIVTAMINANPDMWRYEELRLAELLRRRPGSRTPEVRLIRDLDGTVLFHSGPDLPQPLLSRRTDLWDAGRKAGTIEISRSLRPLVKRTGVLALLGMVLGSLGIVTLRDIPLRRLRAVVGALYEEKERAQVTLRSIGDGVITTDARGNVRMLNGVAARLTGWTQEDASGRHLAEVFRVLHGKTREPRENPADRVLRDERAVDLDEGMILVAKDGTERAIEDSCAPIRGAAGTIIGVVLVVRDVTEKIKHREEMQRSVKLESVGVLAGGIAHDFNNYLSQIMGNISMAQLSSACDEDLCNLLARADTACVRARDLTRQLLTFAKGGAPVKEAVSLGELLRTSVDFALTGTAVRAEVLIDEDIPPVSVDAGQINQVINNLIINAKEAMPGGGIITIRAGRVRRDMGDSSELPPGTYVSVSIHDRGAGIAKEVLPRIFDPYFTTKQGGSGLGLATSYSIIKKHNGHIEAASDPGGGSTFRFYLPALPAAALSGRRELPDSVLFGRGKILFMDDEELVRGTAETMLVHLGYEAVCVVNGEEALKLYREARASGRPFDAVILDLIIPGAMGGRETIGRLLEIAPDVKAIVSSGYSEDSVMGDYSQYGFCAILDKPYGLKEMGLVLHRVLGKGQAGPDVQSASPGS